jgi:hypothetical protein
MGGGDFPGPQVSTSQAMALGGKDMLKGTGSNGGQDGNEGKTLELIIHGRTPGPGQAEGDKWVGKEIE